MTAMTHILVVQDMEKAKHWYLNILGAELNREYGGTSTVLSFLGNWLLLVTDGEPTPDKPTITFKAQTDSTTVSHAFTIRVNNCQKVYENLLKKGAAFETPPYDWGAEIRCFFRDPDQNLWEISEAVS